MDVDAESTCIVAIAERFQSMQSAHVCGWSISGKTLRRCVRRWSLSSQGRNTYGDSARSSRGSWQYSGKRKRSWLRALRTCPSVDGYAHVWLQTLQSSPVSEPNRSGMESQPKPWQSRTETIDQSLNIRLYRIHLSLDS